MVYPWHHRAKCAQPGTDYRDYDCDSSARGADYALQVVRAVEACEGCPVAAECARWALEERPIGVVVAGVALPSAPWWTPSYQGRSSVALERIADGGNMHHVVASEMCSAPSLTPAASVLVDRLLAIGRGVPMPPTVLSMVWGVHHV